jgi:hypothetical protein
VTYGMPTWIWSVAVGDDLYARLLREELSLGPGCRAGEGGRITAAGMTKEVTLEPVDGPINDSIDEAYHAKYHGSPISVQ